LQAGQDARPSARDERYGQSPHVRPGYKWGLDKEVTLPDRESGLSVPRESDEHGDADQATRQQDEQRDEGTPCLSRGKTMGQKRRECKGLEHDAGRQKVRRNWAEVSKIICLGGTGIKAD
jgi:hypothetical protein